MADALVRAARAVKSCAAELNALDAAVGDGDLGTTLSRCADALEGAPWGARSCAELLQEAGVRCAAASGSSFATLLGAALRAASRASPHAGTPHQLSEADVALILERAAAAVAELGEAREGDKTMLDALLAVARSRPLDASAWTARHAARALQTRLDAMRSQPGRIGRARLHASRAQDYDDPGMVAVLRMAEAL